MLGKGLHSLFPTLNFLFQLLELVGVAQAGAAVGVLTMTSTTVIRPSSSFLGNGLWATTPRNASDSRRSPTSRSAAGNIECSLAIVAS